MDRKRIDDFVLCLQCREDVLRVEEMLLSRLGKLGLSLERIKNQLVEFGRFAQTHAPKRRRKRLEIIYYPGFALDFTRNQKGNFKLGLPRAKERCRLSRSNLPLPYRELQALKVLLIAHAAKSVVRETRSKRPVGAGGWRPPPATRSAGEQSPAISIGQSDVEYAHE